MFNAPFVGRKDDESQAHYITVENDKLRQDARVSAGVILIAAHRRRVLTRNGNEYE